MATKKKTTAKASKPASKQTLEFKVLDAATKAKVIQCLEKRGKITVSLKKTGGVGGLPGTRFAQEVD
jgi:hypothetical protein